jgi:hypothetical protein
VNGSSNKEMKGETMMKNNKEREQTIRAEQSI